MALSPHHQNNSARQTRPNDDYGKLTRNGDMVRLCPPDLRSIRLEASRPDALWELCNEHGQRQEQITIFRRILERNSYKEDDEQATVEALWRVPSHLRAVWRYSGALIEHLYLGRNDDLAYAERAARLCRVLIAFFQQGGPDADEALPALWRSYRDALGVMVVARDVVLQLIDHSTDQGEYNRKFEALLSYKEHAWLGGWHKALDGLYRQAQREVAAGLSFRTLELRIYASTSPPPIYTVELRVEGSTRLHRGALDLDPAGFHQISDPYEYGRTLGERFFADTTFGAAYTQAWQESWNHGEYVRVLLRIEPPELRAMSWERIYYQSVGGWQPLGTNHTTPFARLVAVPDHNLGLDLGMVPERPLRALVIIASPTDLDDWGVPQITPDERAQYHDLFTRLPGIKVKFLESETPQRPSLDNLRRALVDDYDLIHFVCHGVLRQVKDEEDLDGYALLLENDSGRCARVTAKEILNILSDMKHPPQLCILAACQSAEHNGHAAFVPLGEAIVQHQRVERAVAMNGNVGIDTARRFTEAFYQQLVAHRSIDLAMNEARSAIRERWDFGMPILFRG